MRTLNLGTPVGNSTEAKLNWIMDALRQIETASYELDAVELSDEFTVTNTPTDGDRTLDADTGVLADLAAAQAAIDKTRDVLCTLIRDMKRRGAKQT